MFQKSLDYNHNAEYSKFVLKIRDSILRDPEFVAYVNEHMRNGNTNAITTRNLQGYFSDFVSSIEDQNLKTRFSEVSNILSMCSAFDLETSLAYENSKPSTEPGKGGDNLIFRKKWDDIVREVNRLCGYDVESKEFLHPETQIGDTTHKTLNSLMDDINTSFDNRGYEDLYKNNPKGKMIMHLGQICDGFMSELSEFALQANIDNFREGYLKDISEEPLDTEKKLVEDMIATQKNLFYVPEKSVKEIIANPEAYNEYKKKVKEKEDELAVKQQINDEELKEMQLKDELVKQEIANKENEIWLDVKEERPSGIEEELEKLRKGFAEQNKEIEEYNKAAAEFNKTVKENNDRINDKIKDIETLRDQQLAELDKVDPKLVEEKERQEWEQQRSENLPKLEALKAERDELEKRFTFLREGVEAGSRVQNKSYYDIPDSHFQTIEDEQNSIDAINGLSQELFDLGDRERDAKPLLSSIKDEDVKKFKGLNEKLAKLNEEKDGIDLKNDASVKNVQKFQEITLQIADLNEEIEGMGPVGKAISAMADWRKKNPELAKELDALKAEDVKNGGSKNDYQLLRDLTAKHEQNIVNEKKQYEPYYQDLAKFKKFQEANVTQSAEKYDEAEITKRLIDLRGKIEELEPKVSKENFEKNLKEKLSSLDTQQNVDARREKIKQDAQGLIEHEKTNLLVPDDYKKPVPQSVIDETIDKERKELTTIYNAHCGAEVAKRLAPEKDTIVRKAMKSYRDSLEVQRQKLRVDQDNIEKLNENAKKIYNHTRHINDSIPKLNQMWASTNPNLDSPMALVEMRIDHFANTIDNGKTNTHKDTDEFKRMRTDINNLREWLANNKQDLRAGNKDACNTFKGLLHTLNEGAQEYVTKKQSGIHWFPSRMRFARLQYAEDLQNFCKTATEKADKNVALHDEREKMTQDVSKFTSKVKPISNFPEYKDYIDLCEKRYGEKAPVKENVKEVVKEVVKEDLIENDKEIDKEVEEIELNI